ncbi:MAG: MotA/TolQ/ExbB proton channel family protein [Gammaproteobacteria bacterium]
MRSIRHLALAGAAVSVLVISSWAFAQAPANPAGTSAHSATAAAGAATAAATVAATAAATTSALAAAKATGASAAPASSTSSKGLNAPSSPGMFSFANIVRIANISAGVFYVMIVILLIELTVIIDRVWYLSRTIRRGSALSNFLSTMTRIDVPKLETMAESSRGPQSDLVKDFVEYAKQPGMTTSQVDEFLDESILKQQLVLNERIWILDTAITLGPLLGLLGTIIGMFDTFSVLGNIESGGATSQVSGGIAAALVTTGQGIFIACLGLIFYNAINTRVRHVMHQLETIKVVLINRLRVTRREEGVDEDHRLRSQGAALGDTTEHLF